MTGVPLPYDQRTPGARRARDLIRQVLGTAPVRVWPTESPDAKFAELPDGRRVVVKWPEWRNDVESIRAEAWAHRRCREAGLRVPELVAAADDPTCLITEVLPGETLADRDPREPATRAGWAEAGAELRRLHEIRLPGFGPLRARAGTARGAAAAWCPYLDEARDRGVAWLVDRGFLDRSAGDRLVRCLTRAAPALAELTDGRLLHSDLSGGHVLVGPDGFGGIIDLGQAQVGDPRWDFARVLLWDGDPALDALLDGYGREVLPDEERHTVLPLYLFAYCCHHAVGHPNDEYIALLLERSRWRALL
ncbi:phosphotransferase family protein [Microlunatus parietis]|uniref:Aminoglycoside phosphotransferase n=1 Tax=Microlunatus parietis TaxID=682979 RepID=A0A7Y9L6J0_9ACTN|nr:phosphotransferase [Microlunatus parietis]NYE68834.1 aminoglycoside phosphotransferase [Microlunatus parietis]